MQNLWQQVQAGQHSLYDQLISVKVLCIFFLFILQYYIFSQNHNVAGKMNCFQTSYGKYTGNPKIGFNVSLKMLYEIKWLITLGYSHPFLKWNWNDFWWNNKIMNETIFLDAEHLYNKPLPSSLPSHSPFFPFVCVFLMRDYLFNWPFPRITLSSFLSGFVTSIVWCRIREFLGFYLKLSYKDVKSVTTGSGWSKCIVWSAYSQKHCIINISDLFSHS